MATVPMNRAIIYMLIAYWLVIVPFPPPLAWGDRTDIRRFQYGGDGRISLRGKKNGAVFSGRYRKGKGAYDPVAVKQIHEVFQAPYTAHQPGLSLRLVEFLDYLEDRLEPGARITITSGYRNPQYNQSLRDRGGVVAKASLHQYGMAADLIMEGVPSKRIWEHVKALGFGGAGYYHGRTVHVDVGPARSWDEKTSGVGSGLSEDNKLIGLVTQYDIYRSGERLELRFIRMTAFPIGVRHRFYLEPVPAKEARKAPVPFTPTIPIAANGDCLSFSHINEMARLSWTLPTDLPPGAYRVRARFCQIPWEEMPREILTPAFRIVKLQ